MCGTSPGFQGSFGRMLSSTVICGKDSDSLRAASAAPPPQALLTSIEAARCRDLLCGDLETHAVGFSSRRVTSYHFEAVIEAVIAAKCRAFRIVYVVVFSAVEEESMGFCACTVGVVGAANVALNIWSVDDGAQTSRLWVADFLEGLAVVEERVVSGTGRVNCVHGDVSCIVNPPGSGGCVPCDVDAGVLGAFL